MHDTNDLLSGNFVETQNEVLKAMKDSCPRIFEIAESRSIPAVIEETEDDLSVRLVFHFLAS